MTPNYITPGGFKKLQDEYLYLKTVERPRVTKIVTWAASLGDRSENADYQYGKKRLREIDRRLRFLGKRIGDAKVVNPLQIESVQVQFGATVSVCDEEDQQVTYSIVGVDETDTKRRYISWRSPIGHTLLGKSVGDVVSVKIPKGEIEIEVISIDYKEIITQEYIYEGASEHQSR